MQLTSPGRHCLLITSSNLQLGWLARPGLQPIKHLKWLIHSPVLFIYLLQWHGAIQWCQYTWLTSNVNGIFIFCTGTSWNTKVINYLTNLWLFSKLLKKRVLELSSLVVLWHKTTAFASPPHNKTLTYLIL